MTYYTVDSNPRILPFRIDKALDGKLLCQACNTWVSDIRNHECPEFEAWDKIHNAEYYKKLEEMNKEFGNDPNG